MSNSYFNPFQQMDVLVPDEHHASVSRYSQTAGGSPDASPFRRMVDYWFIALCLAARAGLKPRNLQGIRTRKIIEGTIFSNDPWRVQVLHLLAIGYEGDINIVTDSRRIMNIANGLAAAGMPLVLEMIQSGGAEAIWNLSESVRSELLAS